MQDVLIGAIYVSGFLLKVCWIDFSALIMAKRAARRLEDFTSLRTALSALESQALSTALRACAPQVETSCHQLESQAVTTVLQSILSQVKSTQQDLAKPVQELETDSDTSSEAQLQGSNTTSALLERLHTCKSLIHTIETSAFPVKSQMKSTISVLKATFYRISEWRSKGKRALKRKDECVDMAAFAGVKYHDKAAELGLWTGIRRDSEELLAANVQKLEELEAIVTTLEDNLRLIALQTGLEAANMATEEQLAKIQTTQAQLSHNHSQISHLQLSYQAENTAFLTVSATQAALTRDIADITAKIPQTTCRLQLARLDYKSKLRISHSRMSDLERIHMEKADIASTITYKRLQWTRMRDSLEKDHKSFASLAAKLNESIVQANAKAQRHTKEVDRQGVEEQCKALEEEYQGRRSTVAREIQSDYTLKTEN